MGLVNGGFSVTEYALPARHSCCKSQGNKLYNIRASEVLCTNILQGAMFQCKIMFAYLHKKLVLPLTKYSNPGSTQSMQQVTRILSYDSPKPRGQLIFTLQKALAYFPLIPALAKPPSPNPPPSPSPSPSHPPPPLLPSPPLPLQDNSPHPNPPLIALNFPSISSPTWFSSVIKSAKSFSSPPLRRRL